MQQRQKVKGLVSNTLLYFKLSPEMIPQTPVQGWHFPLNSSWSARSRGFIILNYKMYNKETFQIQKLRRSLVPSYNRVGQI